MQIDIDTAFLITTGKIPLIAWATPLLVLKTQTHCKALWLCPYYKACDCALVTKLCTFSFEINHFLSFLNKLPLHHATSAIRLFDRIAAPGYKQSAWENRTRRQSRLRALIFSPSIAWGTHLFFHEFNSTRYHIIPTQTLLGLVKRVTNPESVCVGGYAHQHYNINTPLKSHFTLVNNCSPHVSNSVKQRSKRT